jgi:hypothetical protein
MKQILMIEVIGYLGIILLQAIWAVRGELTEQRFAIFQVAALSLLMITVVLFSSTPEYPFGLFAGIFATFLFCVIGYPILRWVFRQVSPPK